MTEVWLYGPPQFYATISKSASGVWLWPVELSLALPLSQPSCPERGVSSHQKGLLNHGTAIIPAKVRTSEYSQDTTHYPLGPSKHQTIKKKSFQEAISTRPLVDYFIQYIVI